MQWNLRCCTLRFAACRCWQSYFNWSTLSFAVERRLGGSLFTSNSSLSQLLTIWSMRVCNSVSSWWFSSGVLARSRWPNWFCTSCIILLVWWYNASIFDLLFQAFSNKNTHAKCMQQYRKNAAGTLAVMLHCLYTSITTKVFTFTT